MRIARALFLATVCASMGCDSTSPLVPSVGTGGGSVQSANNSAKVTIPGGALPASVNVTVAPATTAAATPGLVTGAAYEFGPTGTQFSTPVTISIAYDPATLPANIPESSLRLYTQVGSSWVLVDGSTVNTSTHTVSGNTTHFSTYAPIGSAAVSAIVISSSSTSLAAGSSIQLSAVAQDAGGNLLTGRTIAWSSADPSKATVSATGLVTGVDAGTVTISATAEGRSATTTLTITPAPVATVTISPASANVVIGATTSLSATTKDAAGNALQGRSVTWTSSDVTRASVSPAGVVTAFVAGPVTITAASEGKSATAIITVVVPPVASVALTPGTATVAVRGTFPLSAMPRDASGVNLSNRTITWSSADTSIATVSSSGVVTGVRQGIVNISATSEGKTGTAVITSVLAVQSVTITPASASLVVGASIGLGVTVLDDANQPVSGRTVTWVTSDPTIASISPAGVLTGLAAGTATISATVENIRTSINVAVTSVTPTGPAPVATVVVTYGGSTIIVGTPAQVGASPKDASGNALAGRTVTWASSNTAVATISSTGLLTPLTAGTVIITATSEGKTGSVTLTIAPTPIANVVVTPATSILTIGATAQLAAATNDANGFPLTGRAVVWTSSDNTKASVSTTGLVTAIAAGTVTISAISEGKTGTATINVPTQAAVASLAITPATTTVNVAGTTTLVATPRDASNNVLSARVVTWSSSDVTKATVSSTGVVTGFLAGTVTITAVSEGISATSTVNVVVPVIPVAHVVVTPHDVSLVAGTSASALTVVVSDVNFNVLTDRPVTFSSLVPAVATVSTTGVITGVSAGSATIVATSESITGVSNVTVTAANTPAAVATVEVTPTSASLVLGTTVQLNVVTKDAAGNVVTGRAITYAPDNTSYASISTTGLVTALRIGTVNITVASEGKFVTFVLTVTPIPAASVVVAPANQTGVVGGTMSLSANAYNAANQVLGGYTFTWTSSNPAVATVSTNGAVTGVSAGTATITATTQTAVAGSTGITFAAGTAPVFANSITPLAPTINTGATVQLTAHPVDANGTALTGRTVTWTSSNIAIASVSPAGLVTGASIGTVTITSTSENKAGTTTVTVVSPPTASITVTPTSATILTATATQLTATPRDANGNAVFGRTVNWSTSNASVATVSGSGGVTGLAAGTATITAALDGFSATSVITVIVGSVTAVHVIPSVLNLATGETGALGVTLDAGTGTHLTTFSSSNTGVAIVSSTGVVTAVAVGSAVITATSETKTASSAVTVSTAMAAASIPLRLDALSVSANHACGLNTAGAAFCWGYNGNGGLGNNTNVNESHTPVTVGGGKSFANISTDDNLSCGIATDNTLYCWGGGSSFTVVPTPTSIAPGISFAQVSANSTTTCALATDGTAYCAGNNFYGQLGSGNAYQAQFYGSQTFLKVAGGLRFRDIATFGEYVCAITADTGALYCWGRLDSVLNGTSVPAQSNTPVLISSAVAFTSLAQHGNVCGLNSAGQAYCIGADLTALGGAARSSYQVPVRIGGTLTFKKLNGAACGISTTDALYCWGNNSYGALGVGSNTIIGSTSPLAVATGRSFSTVTSNGSSTCAIASDGVGYCWGYDFNGQLGIGSTATPNAPTAILGSITFRTP